MSQLDPVLGKKIHDHLVNLGIETPMIDNGLTEQQKMDIIKEKFGEIMDALGLDRTDDSLEETPRRVAKMYVREMFKGMSYDSFPKCTTIDNKMSTENEFVCLKDIRVISTCEHHFAVILGSGDNYAGAVVAYIPKTKVLGLSKMSRIVDFFLKRPQVQERATNQIMEAMKVIVESDDVAVYIDAVHTCLSTRGIMDTGACTVTLAVSGQFKKNDKIRQEFLSIANRTGKK